MSFKAINWTFAQKLPLKAHSIMLAINDRLDDQTFRGWMGQRDIRERSRCRSDDVADYVKAFERLGVFSIEIGGPRSKGSIYTLSNEVIVHIRACEAARTKGLKAPETPIDWSFLPCILRELKAARKLNKEERAARKCTLSVPTHGECAPFSHVGTEPSSTPHNHPSNDTTCHPPAAHATGDAAKEKHLEGKTPSSPKPDSANQESEYTGSQPDYAALEPYEDKHPARAVRAADGPRDATGRPTQHRAETDEHFQARLAAWERERGQATPPLQADDPDWARATRIAARLASTSTALELSEVVQAINTDPDIIRWAVALREHKPQVVTWLNQQLADNRAALQFPNEAMQRHAEARGIDAENVADAIQSDWGERPRGDAGKKWDRRFYAMCGGMLKQDNPWVG